MGIETSNLTRSISHCIAKKIHKKKNKMQIAILGGPPNVTCLRRRQMCDEGPWGLILEKEISRFLWRRFTMWPIFIMPH